MSPGYTQLPNYLWDLDLNIYQRAILVHIVRKTIGWGKDFDGISLSQFSKDLGISKPKVISTLKELKEMGLIEITNNFSQNNSKSFNTYKISKKVIKVVNEINHPSKSDLPPLVNEVNYPSKCGLPPLVNDINYPSKCGLHTKETKTKETSTKETKTKKEKINKKEFSFTLSKKSNFENLSKEYKKKLKAKCLLADGDHERYENFINTLEAKGYQYQNFYKAYLSWDKEKRYKTYKPVPEPLLGEGWYKVITNDGVIAINKDTLEMRIGVEKAEPKKPDKENKEFKIQTSQRNVENLISDVLSKKRISA